MLLNPVKVHSPQSLPEALSLYSNLPEVRLMAGGTFLLNSLKLLKKRGIKTPQNIISLRKIRELQGVWADEKFLTINSMTVISALFESPLLIDNFAVLKTVCRNISTNPIRNMATVGGNLTSRYTWTELGAPLIALDATMHFEGLNNEKEQITVEEFFKNSAKTNKILTHLTIPRNKKSRLSYQRVKKLSDVDVPLLGVCVRATVQDGRISDARVSVNSTTAFSRRDPVLEKFLNASPAEEKIAAEALDHLDIPLYDTRSDDYKKSMFRTCIKRAVSEVLNKGIHHESHN